MKDYKSLCAADAICGTLLVDIQTDRYTVHGAQAHREHFDQLISKAQRAELIKLIYDILCARAK